MFFNELLDNCETGCFAIPLSQKKSSSGICRDRLGTNPKAHANNQAPLYGLPAVLSVGSLRFEQLSIV